MKSSLLICDRLKLTDAQLLFDLLLTQFHLVCAIVIYTIIFASMFSKNLLSFSTHFLSIVQFTLSETVQCSLEYFESVVKDLKVYISLIFFNIR